ncbi:MAG: hypothetical protein IJ725_05380, partial [Ruminococcus sp.]|nr:hypothetical protein [Ruminococcus sp.]
VHIAANTENITMGQSAVVSLTAAIAGKLNNSNASVSSSNIADNAVTTAKIADSSVSYDKLSTSLQDKVDAIPDISMYVEYLGTLSSADAFNSGDYCTLGGVHQFRAAGALATAIGVEADTDLELRYVNGYQVITQTDTQQVYSRKITRVALTFAADNWSEVTSPAVTALQTTVGTLNTQLENALNGGA